MLILWILLGALALFLAVILLRAAFFRPLPEREPDAAPLEFDREKEENEENVEEEENEEEEGAITPFREKEDLNYIILNTLLNKKFTLLF